MIRFACKSPSASPRGQRPAIAGLIMAAVLACVGLSAVGPSFASGWGEAQYREFYQEFYRQPQPQQIPDALDYFVSPAAEGAKRSEVEMELAGGARFFAVLAETHPIVWRHGERQFSKIYWSRKNRWLEIFKRNQDEQLKANARRWATKEEDHDRRIWLQQLVVRNNTPLSILENPIRDQSQLEEHWACFFAAGNTQVVRNTVALLGNTAVGYTYSEGAVRLDKPRLLPRERRLRDRASRHLVNRAARHPLIRQALLLETKFLQSETGFPILRTLAYQALERGDAEEAKQLADLGVIPNLTQPEQRHFSGLLDFLTGKDRAAQDKIRFLERDHRVWAECLRACGVWVRHDRQAKTWQRTALPAGGKQIPQRAAQALGEAKSMAVLERWNLETAPRQERPSRYYRQTIFGTAQPDRRFKLKINTWPREGWALESTYAFRWTDRRTGWVPIENPVISTEMAEPTELKATQKLLTDTHPTTMAKIIGNAGDEFAELRYRDVRDSGLFRTSLDKMFPGQSHRVRDLRLIVNLETGRLVHLQATLALMTSGNIIAAGQVERFFYAYDALDLDWIERLP